MRALALLPLCLLLLNACQPEGALRNNAVPLASSARFDASSFAGTWVEIEHAGPTDCAGRTMDFTPTGANLAVVQTCLDAAGQPLRQTTGLVQVTGPGRLSMLLDGAATPLWILWIDEDHRTAAVAHPNGRSAAILNRTPDLRADRLRAARDVLDFNGFDTTRLQPSTAPAARTSLALAPPPRLSP